MIAGHATSITLEPEFWNKLKEIAAIDNVSLNSLITKIDADKDRENLSSAVRVFILMQRKNLGRKIIICTIILQKNYLIS